jgi:PepB aminopeptidase
MTASLAIYLTDQAAPASFGAGAILSVNEQGYSIHLNDDEPALTTIQAAGRSISSQGIPAPKLSGDGWDLESQWAFTQGFMGPKQKGKPIWQAMDETSDQELAHRYQVSMWVRAQVNATPEELSPEILADRAAGFIQSLAPEHVEIETIVGDQLEAHGLVGIYGVGRGSTSST